MVEFRKGDKVRRIRSNFGRTIVGEIYRVKAIWNKGHIEIVENPGIGYDKMCFELISRKPFNKGDWL